MAQITITGNLGNDPETKTFQGKNGEFTVTTFSLGETPRERDKNTGEWKNGTTTWYRVSMTGNLAPLASQLFKGQKVVVAGELKTNEYVNKAGETKQSLEVKASVLGVVPKAESRPVSSFDDNSWSDQSW